MCSLRTSFLKFFIFLFTASAVNSEANFESLRLGPGHYQLKISDHDIIMKVIGNRPIKITEDDEGIFWWNGEEICDDLLESEEYQKTKDGSLWSTNCEIGSPMTKAEIKRFQDRFKPEEILQPERGEKENKEQGMEEVDRTSSLTKQADDRVQRLKREAEERERKQKMQAEEREQRLKKQAEEREQILRKQAEEREQRLQKQAEERKQRLQKQAEERERRQRDNERRLFEQAMMREKRLAEAEEKRDEAAIERQKRLWAAEREREIRFAEAEKVRDRNALERNNRLWKAEKEREARLREAEINREERARERIRNLKTEALNYKNQLQQGKKVTR